MLNKWRIVLIGAILTTLSFAEAALAQTTPEDTEKAGEAAYLAKDFPKAAALFTTAAEQGNATAQYNLATLYEVGWGLQINEINAVFWYSKAADQGMAGAQSSLGAMYLVGKNVPQDYSKAFQLLSAAAGQGNQFAQYDLGIAYLNGLGVAKDEDAASTWSNKLSQPASAQTSHSQRIIGQLLLCLRSGKSVCAQDERLSLLQCANGNDLSCQMGFVDIRLTEALEGIVKDDQTPAELKTPAAQATAELETCAKAASVHTNCMYEKAGVVKLCSKDNSPTCQQGLQKLQELFQDDLKSAEHGNVSGAVLLTEDFRDGLGTEKDGVKACFWASKPADFGQSAAQEFEGQCYDVGGALPFSENDAVKWYTQAANRGLASSAISLARLYMKKGDVAASLGWLKKAAGKNAMTSSYHVAESYYQGISMPKDPVEAFKWYQVAAYLGEPKAEYQLGRMYYNADGVKGDDIQAYAWLSLAADRGNVDAKDDFENVRPQITTAQMQQIESLKVQRLKDIQTEISKGDNWTEFGIDMPAVPASPDH